MNVNPERDIFLEAIELPEGNTRQRFLDSQCGDDKQLRNAVEQLLFGHESDSNPLEDLRDGLAKPIADKSGLLESLSSSRFDYNMTGKQIGSYELMELIGEGGFGLVYVAQQREPVRRTVAIKIVKPGMESQEIMARFEAERQALALMDHPNIAKVFEVGTSEDGRLYFVMELIRGNLITEFCDRQRLSLRQRISLFCDVCSAIQHAHLKGIIHRDVKPSNVMVTMHDTKAVVKVIDFGVAKAIGQQLASQTIYTSYFSMIGTPVYMSPEQAEMSGLDIDTRCDIYSLGVLLYDLLTGTTPIPKTRLDSVGYDEMRRIIREEEPDKPSRRITTLGDNLEAVSVSRGTDSNQLAGMISGDLDWIVLKALEKDRNRRYESASAFADDLQRFLAHQPVVARPPTIRYRLQMYVRRNWVALVTVAVVLVALSVGTAVSLWQASNAIDERNQKELALQGALEAKNTAVEAQLEVEEFAKRLKQANMLMASGRSYEDAKQWKPAYQEFSEAIRVQPKYYLTFLQRGQFLVKLNCWEMAAVDFQKAAEFGSPTDEPIWWGVPELLAFAGQHKEGHELNRQIIGNESNARLVSWNASRSALVSSLPKAGFRELALVAEKKLQDRGRGDRQSPPTMDEVIRDLMDEQRPRPPRRKPRHRDEVPRELQLYVTGMAQLRAGEFERAIELLSRIEVENRSWPSCPITDSPMAIAHFKLGDKQTAQTTLKMAKQSIDQWTRSALEHPSNKLPIPWIDFVETQLLFQEASLLIEGADQPTSRLQNQWASQLEARGLSLIGIDADKK